MIASVASLALIAAPLAVARKMTVENNCDFKIWPAMFSSVAPPDHPTGWEAEGQSSVTFDLPPHWNGRIWARRDCDWGIDDTVNACATGGCPEGDGGKFTCRATGRPPASLAEFNIDADGTDWYNGSLVDGFNLPILIETTKNCKSPACTADVNRACPEVLQIKDARGAVVGCKTDCGIDPNPSNSGACCSGEFSTPDKCFASGSPNWIPVVKEQCGEGIYSWAYDDHTSLFTCPSADDLDYTVTFCP